MNYLRTAVAAATLALGMSSAFADPATLRLLSQNPSNDKAYPSEVATIDRVNKNTALEVKIARSEFSQLGLSTADALRYLSSGAFDIVNVPIGIASRDDPFLEGIDLIGVSTDMDRMALATESYRKVFDDRVGEKFGAKVLALWPFGPQAFFCNKPITGLDDIKGLKVRSYTPTMTRFVEQFGAAPVTLPLSEVYLALQRGVVDCGITSPTSGTSAKFPEVTTHLLPISLLGAMNVHLVSLKAWNKLSPAQQEELTKEFKALETALWEVARTTNEDAVNCDIGQDSCKGYQKYKMTLVPVTDAMVASSHKAAEEVVIPAWIERCSQTYPNCGKVWEDTIGKALGIKIQ
jgi:TRAP-type C4-dicarboxylate transport system substrate-binding protein